MKLLIIEDEKELAETISAYLSDENYLCEIASDFKSAIAKIDAYEYDCILLDIMLPGGSGLRILQYLKEENKNQGVIIISAKNSLEDKVNGLQVGADDYLAKPFHLPELAARIYSIIRRNNFGRKNIIQLKELTIDVLARTVSVNNKQLYLTKKEFDLLLYFVSNKKRVISKGALAEHLSGEYADMFDNYEFVYAHVKNLKRKLTEAGCDGYLKNIYGTGYKLDV
ncbi:MAG: response regulator transcription factor [Chitinophagaceae bacterium]|nr:response regulator transcription factor [Chitinophagaceae bacterium]